MHTSFKILQVSFIAWAEGLTGCCMQSTSTRVLFIAATPTSTITATSNCIGNPIRKNADSCVDATEVGMRTVDAPTHNPDLDSSCGIKDGASRVTCGFNDDMMLEMQGSTNSQNEQIEHDIAP